MGLKMTSPVFRDNSGIPHFRRRVPVDLRDIARGKQVILEFPEMKSVKSRLVYAVIGYEVKFLLGSAEEAVAKVRHSLAAAHIERMFEALRNGPSTLSQKQIVVLSGEVYNLYMERFADNPGSPANWAAFKAFNRAAREGRLIGLPPITHDLPDEDRLAADHFGSDLTGGLNALPASDDTAGMGRRFGTLTNWVLTKNGIAVDDDTRAKLLQAVDQAVTQAAWTLKKHSRGDYRPDPDADRFPTFSSATTLMSVEQLTEKWSAERRRAPSTITTWRTATNSLAEHMGHGNVSPIGDSDIVAWKDKLVASGLAAKTVNSSYIAAINSLFNYAVKNKMLGTNPAKGVQATSSRRAGSRMLSYSNEEVAKLLAAAKTDASEPFRWMIWLAATSGARIGEIAQLWGSGILIEDGVQIMHITPAPDGGSLKNEGSERKVPLHPLIVKEGFLDFVASKGNGALFYKRSSGDAKKTHASKGTTNHLAAWIRKQGFTDPRKAPNHALRHWWKSAAMEAEVADSVADTIQGHATRSEGDSYRHFSLALLERSVAKIQVPTLPMDELVTGES